MPADHKTITIIGGGFTGSSIAIQEARYYAELFAQDNTLPPLTIRLVDGTGSFGPGLPYKTQDDVFLLNQPAYAMSPFPDDPGHFTRWLGQDGDSFATRKQYGEYLQETLARTFNEAAAAGIPVQLEKLSVKVTGVSVHQDIVVTAENTALPTDAVVFATGHQKNSFLDSLDSAKGYFSGVYSVADVEAALKGATVNDNVAIIGTGQSMMDALAVLDHIGYQGQIHAFSRHGAEPWAFDAALYRQELPRYAPLYLDPAHVQKADDQSFAGLRTRLAHEFRRAEKLGYGVAHVLTTIDFAGLATAGKNGAAPEGLKDLHELWEKIYGNPTAPARHALLEQYKENGQLNLVRHEVQAENIAVERDGFVLGGFQGEKPLKVSAVFNAASFGRKATASPLLQKAAEDGLLSLEGATVSPGQQNHPAVFAAGPAVSPHKWGVETFRDNNAKVSRQSVDSVLGPELKKHQAVTKERKHDFKS